jgi:hypothetical protein
MTKSAGPSRVGARSSTVSTVTPDRDDADHDSGSAMPIVLSAIGQFFALSVASADWNGGRYRQ